MIYHRRHLICTMLPIGLITLHFYNRIERLHAKMTMTTTTTIEYIRPEKIIFNDAFDHHHHRRFKPMNSLFLFDVRVCDKLVYNFFYFDLCLVMKMVITLCRMALCWRDVFLIVQLPPLPHCFRQRVWDPFPLSLSLSLSPSPIIDSATKW